MMSVQTAKKFIDQVRQDSDLRRRLNQAESSAQVWAVLEETGFKFSPEEFTEAHSGMLANAPDESAVEDLREFLQWWEMLTGTSYGV